MWIIKLEYMYEDFGVNEFDMFAYTCTIVDFFFNNLLILWWQCKHCMTIILPARWHSSRDIAIKIQKKDAVSSAAFLDEAQLLKQLQHPNIIKLLGVSSETTPIYLLLEYMVNGRLSNYLREGKGHELGLSQLLWIAAQVYRVFFYMCFFFSWMKGGGGGGVYFNC